MGLFKDVVEPATIILAFTAGTLINRRRLKPHLHPHYHHQRDIESVPECISGEKRTDVSSVERRKKRGKSDGSSDLLVFRWLSWIFGTYPFLPEIWYWLLTYWVYQLARAFTARAIAPYPHIYALAEEHALQLLAIERFLHIDFEQAFQMNMLTNHPCIMPVLRHIYHSHIIVGVVFIIYTYTVLPPATYRRIRRTIAMDNFIAFVIISLWRCAPPRMLPPEYGFVDVLHGAATTITTTTTAAGEEVVEAAAAAAAVTGSVWTNNRFRLTIAAMPSLHFGTALLFGVSLARFSPHAAVRWLALLWPAVMFVTVVATANHFVLDMVVGAMVPVLGWRWNRGVLVLKGVHDWVFSPVTHRMEWDWGVEEEE